MAATRGLLCLASNIQRVKLRTLTSNLVRSLFATIQIFPFSRDAHRRPKSNFPLTVFPVRKLLPPINLSRITNSQTMDNLQSHYRCPAQHMPTVYHQSVARPCFLCEQIIGRLENREAHEKMGIICHVYIRCWRCCLRYR